jgi:hypothetical protein
MDRDDPEVRIADLERQQAESRPERRRPGKWMLFFILICAAFPLYYFGYAAYDLYGYSAGTPTTATVTWSVDGQSHTGGIEGPRGGYQLGSTVDVRVLGDTAFTAVGASWRFLAGSIALVIPALLLWYARWIRRARARRTA